ncbi:MAG TPA: HupE/UreJ family protein [Candidatus Acidoferrales bacterium]|nr:HupE/UreJ family protein [Candidatus Acidoferrales bacterium]
MSRNLTRSRIVATAARLALLFFAVAICAAAHDIPSDATVQMFFKPDGNHLNILMRVPLKTMRDVEFPEQGQGYLDFERVDPALHEAATLWLSDFIDVYEGDTRLPKPRVVETRLSLESDPSFASYEQALAHLSDPRLTNKTPIFWDQLMMDVLFEYPIQSDQSHFSIHPGLDRLASRIVIALRFLPPGGAVRAFEFLGDPGLVHLDPRWFQAAGQFVKLGFFHILDGTDHLLFLFCLVIPFRRFRALIPVVTSFTIAHSITLIASAYNLAPDALWFPPLIETLIAMSIVYMALENIVGGATVQRRWMITFGFGLVHGFGFSFALRQTMQFAGSHLLASLLSFNVGVELGQLLVLALMIPALELLFRRVVAERMGTIILSAIVAHTAWHWMLERYQILSQYPIHVPTLEAAPLAKALRLMMLIVIAAGLVWVVFGLLWPRIGKVEQVEEDPAVRLP